MLHNPSHYETPHEAEPIALNPEDSVVPEIAALPVHAEKARMWTKLNNLESERPIVWINEICWNEICWNEMNVNEELTLRCERPWTQDQERELRRLLYQCRHLPGDMIVNDYLTCPLELHSANLRILEDVDIVKTDATSNVVPRISASGLEKIGRSNQKEQHSALCGGFGRVYR